MRTVLAALCPLLTTAVGTWGAPIDAACAPMLACTPLAPASRSNNPSRQANTLTYTLTYTYNHPQAEAMELDTLTPDMPQLLKELGVSYDPQKLADSLRNRRPQVRLHVCTQLFLECSGCIGGLRWQAGFSAGVQARSVLCAAGIATAACLPSIRLPSSLCMPCECHANAIMCRCMAVRIAGPISGSP